LAGEFNIGGNSPASRTKYPCKLNQGIEEQERGEFSPSFVIHEACPLLSVSCSIRILYRVSENTPAPLFPNGYELEKTVRIMLVFFACT